MSKPSYIADSGGYSKERPKKSSSPSYVGGYNGRTDGRPKPRFKTMAEQTGYKAGFEESIDNPTPESAITEDMMPVKTHCPPEEKEVQPPGFQPFPFIRDKIDEFLNHPKNDVGAARLYNRIEFEQSDIYAIDIAEADEANLDFEFILGYPADRTRARLFVGFAEPGPETVLAALEKVFHKLTDWMEGKEAQPTKTPAANVEREGGRDKPPVSKTHYKQKMYVVTPYDYPGEVAVVVV